MKEEIETRETVFIKFILLQTFPLVLSHALSHIGASGKQYLKVRRNPVVVSFHNEDLLLVCINI